MITIRRGPGGGPMVGTVDPANLGRVSTLFYHLAGATYRELFEAWVLAESLLAERAARNPDAALRRERMGPYLDGPSDDEPLEEYIQSHAEFHAAVGSLARNRVLELSLLTMGLIVSHHVPLAYDPRTLREAMEREHHDIAAAIVAGRPRRAQKLMRDHIQADRRHHHRGMGPPRRGLHRVALSRRGPPEQERSGSDPRHEDRPHRLRRPRRGTASSSPAPPTRPGSTRCGSASTSLLPIGDHTAHPSKQQDHVQHHTGPIVSRTPSWSTRWWCSARPPRRRRPTCASRPGSTSLPLRHPLAVARSTCTVQEIAGGRFMFGVGVGWLTGEFDALGVPFDERVDRFLEAIAVLRAAWAGGEVRHEGRHFAVSGVQVTARRTDVPLILGGNTHRALRRAAQLGDGWFSSGTPPLDEAVRLRDELLRLRREADDEAGAERPFELVVRVEGRDPSVLRRYAEPGSTTW